MIKTIYTTIATMAVGFGCLVFLMFEPSPYVYATVRIDGPANIREQVPVTVDLERTKLCPYILQRKIFDGAGGKVFDDSRQVPPPIKLGADTFLAPVRNFDSLPVPGNAIYIWRLGSQCNFVQGALPRWTEWTTVKFRFVE